MFKFLKSLFENNSEHRCQVCGQTYKGIGSFNSSESCTYSHEIDTIEQELRYPKNLRKVFHERKSKGETRNKFVCLLISFWNKDSNILSSENDIFLDNISKTYLPVNVYYNLKNNNKEDLLSINLDNEAHYIYENLNQKIIL